MSDPYDPFCTFEWKVESGIISNLEILNIEGDLVLQTLDNEGTWNFNSGDIFRTFFTLKNDTLSTVCSFEIECPEPELPPIDETICEFFSRFKVSLENESSLYFSSEAILLDSEIITFNELLSQISTIHLDLKWQLGPELSNYLLYSADEPETANLYQLDPQNMTFILGNYNMANIWNQIMQGVQFDPKLMKINFWFTITDIYGKKIVCNFETIVEFPIEEKENNNPLCLTCGDGIYNITEDLGNYNLENGQAYTGNIVNKIIYNYGFPIYVTNYSTANSWGEGILALPIIGCKVIAVELRDLKLIEFPLLQKKIWIQSGEVKPNQLYPGEIPNFDTAPDFVIGAEICVPPRGPNDADGDGIDDKTKLDKYGFGPNGVHKNGTKLDDNGFNVNGWYQGCPRTDDSTLICTKYNPNGCDRDGLDESGNPCPAINDEDWNEFVDKYKESSDSLIATVICKYAQDAQENTDEKVSKCDSIRSVLNVYISDAHLTPKEELLIRGAENKYIAQGMSGFFNSEPNVPRPSIGGRDDVIENIEKTHVDLYYCDIDIEPLEEKSSALNTLCSDEDFTEIQDLIDQALKDLSNLDRQRLMLDANAFKAWIEELVKEYLKENHNIYISAFYPQTININLFAQPTKAYYLGSYTAIASTNEEPIFYDNFSLKDAIDFEYRQGFEVINGIPRAYYVAELGKFNQQNFSPLGGQEPIAIQSVQKSSIFSIYLVNFRFFVDKPALVDAYIELSDPKSNRKIYFAAKDIKFNPDGIEVAKMNLATNISKFKISNAARGTILKGQDTYIQFNCEGIKEIGLKGEVEFCDNIIVPMQQIPNKNDFKRHDSTYFKMGFQTKFTEWLEFETKITAGSPFAMAKHEDLIWIVPELNFDFSSSSSNYVNGFSAPSGFESEFLEGSKLGPGWKGFFCPSLSAVLPALTKSENGDRFTAAKVENLLIDKYGVTCSAEVSTKILGLGKPNMKSSGESTGWSLSIDYFRLDAVQNFIVGGGIRGKILTSLFKDDESNALDYSALILPGHKYKFSVTPKVNLEIPLLVAKAEIERAAITVIYDAPIEKFTAEAKFSGNIKIINDSSKVELPYLKFRELTVINKAPYITDGKWELKGGLGFNNNDSNNDSGSFKGFGFSFSNLKFESCEGSIILGTTVKVGFGLNGNNNDTTGTTKSTNLSIAGDFGLRGKFKPNSKGIQGFKFEKAFLNGLSISGNIGEVVKGLDVKLCWDENNPDYGDTFYGSGKANILDFGEVGIAAQFGKKDDEKYFFVDAFAELPTAIPIAGPIGIDRIGVGVSNNMRLENEATGNGNPTTPPDPEACSPPSCASNFGETYSGFKYYFDASKALAIRASVGFKMTTKPADFIEGTAGLDITFNDGGGISKFGFFGEATMMVPFPGKLDKVKKFLNEKPLALMNQVNSLISPINLDIVKPDISGPIPIMARVEGSLKFGEHTEFDLTAGAFLNWGVIKGAGKDDALVLGKIHIGHDGWNINLGTPSTPSGIILNLGIVNASLKTYFMAGNPLPEKWQPYMPAEVKSFFGSENNFSFLDKMPSNGAGIAFGIHFGANFNAKIPVLGGFEAKLLAGIDVAMINGFQCEGLGFGSGWYAMGQGYLYAGGGLKVLGVDLIKGEAGVTMNAGLTNPYFFNGQMKVKGSFGVWPLKFSVSGNVKVELGDEPDCNFDVVDQAEVAEVLGDINIVESTFPVNGSKNISTSLSQYVINYSVPMGEVLELKYPDTLADQSIVEKTMGYRVTIERIEYLSTKTGWSRNSYPNNNSASDIIKIYNSFAADDSIIVKIIYNVDMRLPESNSFMDVISNEVLEYNFKTGPLALRFEPSNIAGTWPENGMNNFYLGHRLFDKGKHHGIVQFKNHFPWEVFNTPGIKIRSALYQGDNPDPLYDKQIDVLEYFNSQTNTATNAGDLHFDLPDDMALGKNYKVIIYAISDTSDEKQILMDPIHFRTSLYYNLEEKFAEADSMYYVEASPRWYSVYENGYLYNLKCGFEYNLISKAGAYEGWDMFDAKCIEFTPVCDFDKNQRHPKINSADFIECEFNGSDEPPSWHSGDQYVIQTIGELLTVSDDGNNSNSIIVNTNNNNQRNKSKISSRVGTGPTGVSYYDIELFYKSVESLRFDRGGFLLKTCQ